MPWLAVLAVAIQVLATIHALHSHIFRHAMRGHTKPPFAPAENNGVQGALTRLAYLRRCSAFVREQPIYNGAEVAK